MILPEDGSRKARRSRAELLNAAVGRLPHIVAIQKEEDSAFTATDEQVLDWSSWLIDK